MHTPETSPPKKRRNLFIRAGAAVYRLCKKKRPPVNIYFISGMCYNCKVFDSLTLPKGYVRHYIEWYIPRTGESLSEYAHTMAAQIDTSRPFVLVGYSFGAVIMQEMTRFLHPVKCIVISSFKNRNEIPRLFEVVRKTRLAEYLPDKLFQATEFVTSAFNRFFFHSSNEEVAEYMTHTDPAYMKWAVDQITRWIPDNRYDPLYHIHGTADQIFPYNQIEDAIPVEDGDHLMVVKKAAVISSLLGSVLLIKPATVRRSI